MDNKSLNEDLERFKSLFGYDPKKGKELTEAKSRRTYLAEDPEEEEEAAPGEEEGAEDETASDFDFGDEGSPEGEEEMGGEEEMPDAPAEEEGTEDEFGTAGEFSAADELEGGEDEEVEEIDVTAIVKGSDEAKELAQQAVTVGQENSSYLQSLTDKLSNLEAQPEEKLELRSLDSYPFNQKLSDYWEEKAKTDDRYRISTGKDIGDGEETEYVIKPEDIEDFNEADVESSFNPEK
jgi:hypothetical protein